MIGIFRLLMILICIAFIGLTFWIWRGKKWSNSRKVVITILLAAGVIAAVYASFALILIFSDHAYYFTSGNNLGKIDYDMVISNAEKAGYKVDGPYYVNIKPREARGLHSPDVKELDERLGEDYKVLLVEFYYAEDSFFEANLPRDYGGETRISFFNESRPDPHFAPFELKHLPSDAWIIEKFRLMFDLDEQKARHYLTQLKDSINEQETAIPTIEMKERPNLLAVYGNFKEMSSSNSTLLLPVGEGWTEETFYSRHGTKIGTLVYIVPNVRIIHRDGGRKYTIKIDQLGGVNLEIELDVGEEIPEEEYRAVFRKMFLDLGLPPEMLDAYEFEYTPGLW